MTEEKVERKKTELELVAGLFRYTDKNSNIYYTGKSEDGTEYVMFRNSYWKEGASKPYFRVMRRVEKGAAASTVEDQMGHPLEELLDSWLEMMEGMHSPRRMLRPMMERTSIGDWEDRNGEIAVTLDMPGIQKNDIELTVDKHMIKVKATTEDRDYSFNKDMSMELNPDKVKANFNNGVLDITIQKAEESKGKKIARESGQKTL